MAGLYLHIPFCKQACYYCNFHFSTSLKQKSGILSAVLKELELQQHYLEGEALDTIYFGGGTPSLLSKEELLIIFEKIYQIHSVSEGAEITLEANPDDLSEQKLKALKTTRINRLSIGIQSFFDADLQFMNRTHNAKEAKNCIKNAQNIGFQNLTIDLIYGSPTTTNTHWEQNIQRTFDLQIPHISAYCLTVEPNTALHHFIKKGKVEPLEEEKAVRQFEMGMKAMKTEGFEHYEISNFAKPGWHARHNSNYWLGAKYLGIGPSAHSFNGDSRQWNIANNAKYIRALKNNTLPFEKEILTKAQQYNEYILTALRTKWGCDLEKIKQWGQQFEPHFKKISNKYLVENLIQQKNNIFTLTDKGKLLADRIAMELFMEDFE